MTGRLFRRPTITPYYIEDYRISNLMLKSLLDLLSNQQIEYFQIEDIYQELPLPCKQHLFGCNEQTQNALHFYR